MDSLPSPLIKNVDSKMFRMNKIELTRLDCAYLKKEKMIASTMTTIYCFTALLMETIVR